MEPYTRRIDLSIQVDIWNWTSGQITNTIEIINDVTSYRFQKTIKSPKGTCQIQMNPQVGDGHVMDTLKAMDAKLRTLGPNPASLARKQ